MKTLVYIGNYAGMNGKTALVQPLAGDTVLAQFDDIELGNVAFSWNEYPASAFQEIDSATPDIHSDPDGVATPPEE